MELETSRVIQVTNIAPQATRDQMNTLFSFLGKIEDIRLYPSMRDASINIQSRVCFVKFMDPHVMPTSLHMTNTVFIDRAIIVQPFTAGDIPDELSGLEFANSSMPRGDSKLPSHVHNVKEGDQLLTVDESLADQGLPLFPPLPVDTDEKVVEEIRRTVVVMGISQTASAQEVMDYFATGAGEVKYFRWCSKEGVDERFALLEFTDYDCVPAAMRLNNTMLGDNIIKVYYSSQAITKPQAKSNEAALKEIEEAMKKVKEAQSLVNSAVDPLMSVLGVKGSKPSRSRSRTPSRSRDYYRRSRSRSRDRRRSRSRSRDRYYRRRSRSRDRRRSRSRDRRRRRSRTRSRDRRRSRTRSRDRRRDDRRSEKRDVEEGKNGGDETVAVKAENGENGTAENGAGVVEQKRSRSGSRERRRSRSRERKRSRSRSRKRSKRSRSRRRRSRSRDRRRSRTRSRDRRRSRSRDHKSKKSKRDRDERKEIRRDYDQEEQGFEPKKEEKHEAVDMEISNSP